VKTKEYYLCEYRNDAGNRMARLWRDDYHYIARYYARNSGGNMTMTKTVLYNLCDGRQNAESSVEEYLTIGV
jgi:hypothetical protein